MTQQVAQTILAQLGGSKFIAMTGAHSMSSSANALGMNLRSNPKKVSGVRIKLDGNDTYTLIAFKRRPFPECIKEVYRCDGIYCNMLADAFESATGLLTSL